MGSLRAISDWAPYGADPDDRTKFLIDYRGRASHPSLTAPLDIAAQLYREIAQHGPVTVMVSAGLDSQFSAMAAKVSGIDCRYVAFRYNNGLNDHDLETDFFHKNGIAVEYRDIDLIDFHNRDLIEWGRRYETGSPHLLCHMRLASEITDSIPVFSGNPVFMGNGALTHGTISLERYAAISGQNMVGYFMNCDRYLFEALHVLGLSGNGSDYEAKADLFRRAGVDVSPQATKMHGFEKIKEYYDDHPIPTPVRLRYSAWPSKRPYDLLFRYSLNKYEAFASSDHRL